MLVNVALSNTNVPNPKLAYPSVGTRELLGTVRVDASKGEDALTEKILLAMDTINGQVKFLGPLTTDQERLYKRAVCYEAAALLGEDNLDFDTTTAGQVRGENGLNKTQSLRRIVQHTIADLTSRPRNRIRLV